MLGGNFAQILPMIKNENQARIVDVCLQQSSLWPHLKILKLRQNMRLQNDDINAKYARWLGQLSYDSSLNGQIFFPLLILQLQDIYNLYEAVYPQAQLYKAHENFNLFCLQGILTLFNKVDIDMNANLLEGMYGNTYLLFSINSVVVSDLTLPEYSIESLQNIQLAGMPLSKLKLKIGTPVMLLQNLDQPNSLNNGLCMIIIRVLQ